MAVRTVCRKSQTRKLQNGPWKGQKHVVSADSIYGLGKQVSQNIIEWRDSISGKVTAVLESHESCIQAGIHFIADIMRIGPATKQLLPQTDCGKSAFDH